MSVQRRNIDVEKFRLIRHHVRVSPVGAGAVGAPRVLEKIKLLKRDQARDAAGIQVRRDAADREAAIGSGILNAGKRRGLWIQHFFGA